MKILAGVFLAAAAIQAQAPQSVPGIEWARVPAGTFQMGCISVDARCDADEHPRHAVTISRPFDLMTTEVTLGMYRAVNQPSEQPAWSTTPDQPMTVVNWDDARTFCEASGGRLPTEAEWEYAARGGRDGAIYPWGDQTPGDQDRAVNGAAFETDAPRTVKAFGPNGYGLYDMAGNVWEWVADWYGAHAADPVTDPQGASAGQFRVVRGGSYGDDPGNLRASNRNPNRPRNRNINVGFRCARNVSP